LIYEFGDGEGSILRYLLGGCSVFFADMMQNLPDSVSDRELCTVRVMVTA